MKKSKLVIYLAVLLAIIGIAGFLIYEPEEPVIPERNGSVIVRNSSKGFVHIRSDNSEYYFAKDHIRRIAVRGCSDSAYPYIVNIIYTTGGFRSYDFKTQEDASEFARRFSQEAEE